MVQLAQFGAILGMGAPELIIIAVIILLIFGGSQLPKLAKNLGGSVKELRKGFETDKPADKKTDSSSTDEV
ncbi:MAG: twin-arginine translocase TatA/TatE family subunit [Candidatus Saccharimonadales bacterium]